MYIVYNFIIYYILLKYYPISYKLKFLILIKNMCNFMVNVIQIMKHRVFHVEVLSINIESLMNFNFENNTHDFVLTCVKM